MSPLILLDGAYFSSGRLPRRKLAKVLDKRFGTGASAPLRVGGISRPPSWRRPAMTGWLEAWGQEPPSDSMDHGDMGHGDASGGMPGMMDAETMDELEQATGDEFDQMFLTSMIEHHEGAIEMARTEQANGENPDALALAQQVEEDQLAEIEKMKAMLGS